MRTDANHQDTKAPGEPIPAETDEVEAKVVDAVFAVHGKPGLGLWGTLIAC